MKRYLLSLLLVLTWTIELSLAQSQPTVNKKEVKVYSKILKEYRTVSIQFPDGYNKSKYYPVAYVFQEEFQAARTAKVIAALAAEFLVPEMIVVQMDQAGEGKGLSASFFPIDSSKEENNKEKIGTANKYLDFIGKELVKYVDSVYSTSPFRIAIGDSLEAMLLVHSLLKEKRIFNAYLCLQPSLYWGNFFILEEAMKATFLKANKQVLYVGSCRDVQTESADLKISSPDTLEKILKQKTIKGLESRFDDFEKEDVSASISGIEKGMRYVFREFNFPEILTDTSDQIVSKILQHYDFFSKENGFIFLPPEGMINQVGHQLLANYKYDKAIKLFKMNVINYPVSSLAFESLGEAYLAKGDTLSAIKNYQKAVKANPGNTKAIEVLKTIQVQK